MPQLAPLAKQQFFDSNGNPLASGKLYTYITATSTLKTTYQDNAATPTSNANPIILDSRGECSIWLDADAAYRFVLKDSNDVTIWTKDDITTTLNGTPVTVATITALKALAGGAYPTVEVMGSTAAGDGGGGLFRWNSSDTSTGNDGTIVTPNAGGTGRWNRVRNDGQALNVRWFGAKGDGSTDDSAAELAAKNAAVTAGVGLYYPNGTYKGSLALGATDDNLVITGEGWEKTILEAKDSSTTRLEIASLCHYVTIQNLSVKNSAASNNGTHYGIRSKGDGAGNGASYLHLRNVKVDGYNINIKLDEFNGHNLETVWSTNAVHGGVAAPSGACFYAGHATNHSVGLWMRDCHALNGKYGYYLETCEGLTMNDCESLLATTRGFLHTTSGTSVSGMQITNSQFDSSGAGAMDLYKIGEGQFTNVWVSSGNTAAGAGAYGLSLQECDDNTFVGLQSFGCTTDGVQVATGSQKNVFIGCQSISNGSDGYQVDAGANGNIFSACAAWNNTAKGFNFNDTTAAEPNIAVDCYDKGNGTASTFQTKDMVSGGTANGGQCITYTFFRQNIADAAGSGNFSAVPNTDLTVFVVPRSGCLVSIALALDDTRAAGTLNARPTVNGVSDDDLLVTINGSNTQYIYGTATVGLVPVSAGDRIGVFYDTDASWDTAGAAGTVDANAVVVLLTR